MFISPLSIKAPCPSRSKKFGFVDSELFVAIMALLGWHLQSVSSRSRTGLGKHIMRFRNENYRLPSGDYIELVCLNAHNGTSSFRLMLGIFRLLCSNGLIAGTKLMETQRIRHVGLTEAKVKAAIDECLKYTQTLDAKVAAMQSTPASEAFTLNLIKAGLQARGIEFEKIHALREFTRVRRIGDAGETQWLLFNRVQEAIVKGHFNVRDDEGNYRKVRELKAPTALVNVNAALFDAALGAV